MFALDAIFFYAELQNNFRNRPNIKNSSVDNCEVNDTNLF